MKKNSFNRVLSMVLCLLLVLGLFPAQGVFAADTINTDIVNPGFEMDLAADGSIVGWSMDTTSAGGTLELSNSKFKSGTKSLHFLDPDANTSLLRVLSDKIAVYPGYMYTASADIYMVQQTASLVHEVQYFDANDKEIAVRQQVLNKGLALNTWVTLTNVTTAPANAVYMRIGFYTGKGGAADAYIDNVSMVVTPAPVQNLDFEMDKLGGEIQGWSIVNGTSGTMDLSTDKYYSGSKSLYFKDSSGGTEGTKFQVISNAIAVIPGKEYVAESVVNVVYQSHSIGLQINFYNGKGNLISSTTPANFQTETLGTDKWTKISTKFTAPLTTSADTTAVSVKLQFNSGNVSLTEAYFDNASVELFVPPTPSPSATPDATSSPAPSATPSAEPVQNLGFEMEAAPGTVPGWSLVSGTAGQFELSTAKSHSGSKSLYMNDSSTVDLLQVWSDYIPVTAGKDYIAKTFMNVVYQSHRIGLEVHFFNDSGERIGDLLQKLSTKDDLGTNKWTEVQLPFNVPVGATQIRVLFNMGAISTTQAYFDDVSIVEGAPVESSPIYDTLQNPGFELDMKEGLIPNWNVILGSKSSVSLNSSVVRSGAKSLYFYDNDAAAGLRIESNGFRVIPGESYISKVFVNVISQTHNIVSEIYFYDENDAEIKSGFSQNLFGTLGLGTNKWSPMSVYTTAPEGAKYAKVVLYSGTPSVTEAYFDDFTFVQQPKETPLDRTYGPAEDLGPMVMVSLGQAGKMQTNSLGENEAYFVTNGKPGMFWAVDGETGECKFSEVIPNSVATWAMVIGPDKNVYYASAGVLYRYLPAEKKIETLAETPTSTIWDIEATSDGKIYGATYSPGVVFEYDIATGKMLNYGVVKEGQDYVRGLGVHGDYIYAGVGSSYLGLFRINRFTGEKIEINIPGYTATNGMVNDAYIVNNKLLVAVSTQNMVVMDLDTLEIQGSFKHNAMISEPDPSNPNLIYYKYDTKLYKYDLSTNIQTEVPLPVMVPDTGRVKDMEWIKLNSGVKAGKTVMAIITQYGEYMLFDPTDNWISFIILDIAPQPVNIQAMRVGPMDGRVYLGGYQRGMSIYNPFTGNMDVNISSFAQPEDIGFLNGNVYYGTYVGAVMYRYDPTKPLDLNTNPGLSYDIQHQDRPFAIASGDDKLFVGTVADYGELTGTLVIYNEKTNEWKQFDYPVLDQSVISLAYKDGLLYGTTSIWGGLGIDPTTEAAKMFIWDVANEKMLDVFTPNIPAIDETPRMLGDLTFGPDGLLWGASEGTIFAMDVTTKEIVKSKLIRPSLYNVSKWASIQMDWGPDGLLYTTLGRMVVAVDTETLNYKIIYDGSDGFINDMTVGVDGTIYYAPGAGTNMYSIKVPETDATLTSIQLNGTPLEGFIPGKLEYNSKLSPETVVAAAATQANATVASEVYKEQEQTVIKVTATDGKSTLVYRINWNVKDPTVPAEPAKPHKPGVPTIPAVPAEPGTKVIEGGSLKPNDQGAVPIKLEKDVTTVLLPENAEKIVAGKPIILEKENVSFKLAPELLNQLQKAAEEQAIKNPQLSISFDNMAQPEELKILGNAKASTNANVKAAGSILELTLSAVGSDKKEAALTEFDKPLTISYKVDAELNQDLVGVFKIADDGSLTYVGGTVENGSISAEIKSSGKYAVLEINKTFKDVPVDHWASNPLKVMASRLIAKGINDTDFAPEQDITRAEFAALMVRTLGLEAKGSDRFADVDTGVWYAGDIEAAYEAGIIKGNGDGKFAPDNVITREEMAAILLRAYEVKTGIKANESDASRFEDQDSMSSWASGLINAAAELGLVNGRGNNSFVPQGQLTRAESIQAIYNMLKK